LKRPPRLFWKLLLVYSLLNFGAAVLFVLVVVPQQERRVLEVITNRLRDTASLIRLDLADDAFQTSPDTASPDTLPSDLQRSVEEWGDTTDTRITIIAADGTVLADSNRREARDVEAMSNHLNRPEVAEAARSGDGISSRISATLDKPMLYYALRLQTDDTAHGFVRTALPLDEVRAQTRRGLTWVISAAVAINLFMLFCTYVLVERIVRPINVLTEAARAIRRGEFRQVYVDSGDELGELAKAFNETSKELASTIHELGESGQRLATVLEGMSDGVISVDLEERILFANSAVGAMFDFNSEHAQGKSLLNVVRNRSLREAFLTCVGFSQQEKTTTTTSSKHDREVLITAHRLADSVLLVTQDVTESRRFEELRQEFVANVSHELKTPLSSIKAYAETLREGAINDPNANQRFLLRIEEQADRLHNLILDLLSLARIETGKETFEIQPVSLSVAVEESVQGHRAAATVGQIELTIESKNEPSEDIRVLADPEGLRQILDNLIDNAIKYTPAGGRVTVRWRRHENSVELEVDDSGIGIAEEDQERLFERFYRVDRARSRELGSTGLGLSIVKHLTQSFHGSVEVSSAKGTGSVFRVKLPMGK